MADQEGCSVVEAYDRTFGDVYRSLDEDSKRVEGEWRDPVTALKMLQEVQVEEQQAWDEDWMWVTQHPEGAPWGQFDLGPRPPTIIDVLEVTESSFGQSLRSQRGEFTARVMVAEDRHVHVVRYYEASWVEPHGEPMSERGVEWVATELG